MLWSGTRYITSLHANFSRLKNGLFFPFLVPFSCFPLSLWSGKNLSSSVPFLRLILKCRFVPEKNAARSLVSQKQFIARGDKKISSPKRSQISHIHEEKTWATENFNATEKNATPLIQWENGNYFKMNRTLLCCYSFKAHSNEIEIISIYFVLLLSASIYVNVRIYMVFVHCELNY